MSNQSINYLVNIEPSGYQVWKIKTEHGTCVHREDGPAIVSPHGEDEYFLDGENYSKREWEVEMNHRRMPDSVWINGFCYARVGPVTENFDPVVYVDRPVPDEIVVQGRTYVVKGE